MATASVHGDRSQIVSRGKTAPSLGNRTSSAKDKSQKRLNTSDGSSKELVSASKVRSPLPKSPATKTSTGRRPSDRLNPKTIDPVSHFLFFLNITMYLRFRASCCPVIIECRNNSALIVEVTDK